MKNTEVYVFLTFSLLAGIGLTHTIMKGNLAGYGYHGLPKNYPLNPTQFPTNYNIEPNTIPFEDQPEIIPLPMLDCQSECFGTKPGKPRIGQERRGGTTLRQCLADCQADISYHQNTQQKCYTCNCPAEPITSINQDQAITVCKRVCGSDATITNSRNGPCEHTVTSIYL